MPNVDIPQGMDTGGSPRRQDTMGGAPAQTRSERVLEQPIKPPLSEGHTSGSGEGRMEHQFELTANVPITPYDSPLPGGYTPGSDEGRLKLQELMTTCTKLSKQVHDLEKEKDAQAVEILGLKKRMMIWMKKMHPNRGGAVTRQSQCYELLKWKLHENCKVHTLFMDGTPMEINMLVEKKYPLIKELLEKMLNLQLEAEEESTELIKFIKSMLEEYSDNSSDSDSTSKEIVYSSPDIAKASGLSSSKDKVSPYTLIVKSPVPITNYALGLVNAKTMDVIFDKTFEVKMPTVITGAEEKKGKREIGGGS
ncbi:hypothetical protein Tco_0093223 [Tanacetum coccineum]